jgi:polyisoprenoid-binding protein YceI
VPPSSWQQLTIVSTITQFISVQFTESKAVVYVVNESSNGLLSGQVVKMGPTAAGAVSINAVQIQSVTGSFQGNGQQWVWLNADSAQDSQEATISLQSLS